MATVTLHTVRGDEDSGRREETYEVPYREGMSLLDAIFWIREHQDASFAVRYSCRSANACKECMALIDGKAGFLCSVRAVPETAVRLEPLPTMAWIKDLATALE
ncbi:2Fe-2S iron-sulfur cluster-binding protein [Paenibacillus daejeonensis]|uniref:2Fe-2S iron-sulfur cluster-binding protein n=1 Tax=Paenibacillus daejeonensis TaxID=135193 RepID=UPI000372EA59|nr:2Fe-2S iron-sulfur cluster-binding protein [Paenibacillus daejeonensis]